MIRSILLIAIISISIPALALPRSGGVDPPDFTRDVRPILTRHCFKCHGPDEMTRAAGLRLDLHTGATAKLKSGRTAIVPAKPGQSELLRRVNSSGPGLMPPVTENKPLSSEQKEILRRWIASGAKYSQHWAFVAPVAASLPSVKRTSWVRNPIDQFVLAKLEAAGLEPNPEADRVTLIRRAYLDLIGIPPTPQEANAFMQDRRPDAYERVVDSLLASPHYGERWARRWLDLARYADTNGYEKDRPRSIWPYRDWVIQALNADMPFDQFTIEQIAGDMLPGATLSQRIATGFHRNTMLNEEGGIDPNEFRFYALNDRVSTTGTAWLGLTLNCAQCHTHKFDPVTQRDYYRMMAFLNNAEEPEVEISDSATEAARRKVDAEAAEREARLAEKFPAADGLTPGATLERSLARWTSDQEKRARRWRLAKPLKAVSNLPWLEFLPDGSILAGGDQTKRDVYDLEFETDLQNVTAIRIEAIPDERLPKNGPGRTWYEGPFGDFFLSEVNARADGSPIRFTRAFHSFAAGNSTAERAIDGDPQTGWSISGAQGKTSLATFVTATPLSGSKLSMSLLFERYYASGLGRFRVWVTPDPTPVQADLPRVTEEALVTPEERRTAQEREAIRRHFLQTAPELKAERDEIEKLRASAPVLSTTLVFQERPEGRTRPTVVRRRGEFLQPAEEVKPGLPSFLPPLPKGAPTNRLSFARWLVSAKNPLTARVTVNRHWQAFFGKGIVRTLEDFGYQGALPTNQALLDWLAVRFSHGADGGPGSPLKPWSVKDLHRLIVTSATYRQSSRVSQRAERLDPENRLLSRFPRVRIEGELVRDAALAVSGLLSRKIGGPSVFPPQPAGVTAEGTYGALAWKTSEGEDRYRRGLYTYMKRTAPYAMLATFDGPSGEACVARREVTNTPLQALTALNDLSFLEAARALGKDAAAQRGTDAERASALFRKCLTRAPSPLEVAEIVSFVTRQRKRAEMGERNAEALVGTEKATAEQAVWTALARSLLNTDEMVVKR